MIVVSDTTALTTLMKAGLESVLKSLFGTVVIPEMVAHELRQFHTAFPLGARSEKWMNILCFQSSR